jgi:anti-sigma regulatory factor (Ser/Thr protein kinase)
LVIAATRWYSTTHAPAFSAPAGDASGEERVMCCADVIGREPSLGAFAGAPCAHLALDAEPRASRLARAFIREAVDDDDADLLDEVALLTSELVTNAVIYARTPVEIGVVHDGERVLVAVGDQNLARPEQQPYNIQRAGGRGLMIVRKLSEAWGVTTYDATSRRPSTGS